MRNYILIFLVISHVHGISLIAQPSKKDTNNWYSRLSQTKIQDIREGRHLELAKEFSLENFIEYYVREGKERFSKKDGNLTIELLFKDSIFFYFGHLWDWGLKNFFKVQQKDLIGINYQEIDDKELRKRFIDEIVPAADKEKVKKRGWGCTTFTGNQEFNYRYIKSTKEIEISYKWKEVCDFVAKLINNTYIAYYNIDTKTFSNKKILKGAKRRKK